MDKYKEFERDDDLYRYYEEHLSDEAKEVMARPAYYGTVGNVVQLQSNKSRKVSNQTP